MWSYISHQLLSLWKLTKFICTWILSLLSRVSVHICASACVIYFTGFAGSNWTTWILHNGFIRNYLRDNLRRHWSIELSFGDAGCIVRSVIYGPWSWFTSTWRECIWCARAELHVGFRCRLKFSGWIIYHSWGQFLHGTWYLLGFEYGIVLK